MKHVDVVIDAVDYFEDGYFNPKFSCVLGNTNQWAYVSTGQIEAVLETCQGLKSLRLYLDAWRGETSFDHFYESSVFRALWYYTAPECFRDREDNVVKEWKEECKKRGIDFKIIARICRTHRVEEEDLTQSWDLPEHVWRDEERRHDHDKGLSWAIFTNRESRSRSCVRPRLRSAEL